MKILFLGDIFGKTGREAAKRIVPQWRKKYRPDLTIANVENMSHGKGFSPDQVAEMQAAGIDFFTSGNHVWKDRSGVAALSDPDFPVLRPANYPEDVSVPGRGFALVDVQGTKVLGTKGVGKFSGKVVQGVNGVKMKKVAVINLMGRVFMREHLDCPFRSFDRIFQSLPKNLAAVFVDFHAETTSEKMALAYYVDGRASVLVGTHTHVPTRDERILAGGTAFISDVGFVGPIDSVIGMEKGPVIQQFLTQIPQKHEPAEGPAIVNAVLIEVDPKTRKAKKIGHIQAMS